MPAEGVSAGRDRQEEEEEVEEEDEERKERMIVYWQGNGVTAEEDGKGVAGGTKLWQ